MKTPKFLCAAAGPAIALLLSTTSVRAFTFTLQEQGSLTGFVNGGGGSVIITSLGSDHWQVDVIDSRIGTSLNPTINLAFIEPELVSGMTAYNNIQVLSVVPGQATFDVLSDEFSPYSTVIPNNTPALIQNTTIEPIYLRFNDFADGVPEPAATTFLVGSALATLRRPSRGTRRPPSANSPQPAQPI